MTSGLLWTIRPASPKAAAVRYQKRNIAEGKCMKCPEPLARNSVC